MHRISILIFTAFFIIGCNGNSGTKQNTTQPTTTVQPPAPVNDGFQLPAITQDFAQNLFDRCDYIDLIMYQEGFSMNIAQKPSIQTLIASLSTANPQINSNCPARGRLFFQEKGKSIGEADLHFTNGVCAALVFYEKGKKIYTTQMTEQGANIFGNYFNNAAQLKQKATEGH